MTEKELTKKVSECGNNICRIIFSNGLSAEGWFWNSSIGAIFHVGYKRRPLDSGAHTLYLSGDAHKIKSIKRIAK